MSNGNQIDGNVKNPGKTETAAKCAHPLIRQEDGKKQPVYPGSVIIVCGRPGLRRAGILHEQVKIWKNGDFSAAQLSDIARDPQFTVIEVP